MLFSNNNIIISIYRRRTDSLIGKIYLIRRFITEPVLTIQILIISIFLRALNNVNFKYYALGNIFLQTPGIREASSVIIIAVIFYISVFIHRNLYSAA